jgi:molecular chaperone DnaK
LKLRQAIRAGNSKDGVRIPIYQGDYNAAGTDPELNHLVYEVVITGADIPGSLQEGSNMDITIKIDKSQTMLFKAYFPVLDYSTEMDIAIQQTSTPSATDLAKQIGDAKTEARKAGETEIVKKCSDLEERLENEKGSADGLMNIQDSLNKIKRGQNSPVLDKWTAVEQGLREANRELNARAEKAHNLSPQIKAEIDDCNRKMLQIISAKDVKLAKNLTEEMSNLMVQLIPKDELIVMLFIYLVQSGNPVEHPEKWSDSEMAIVLIEGGLKLLNANKIIELIPIVQSLRELWIGEILLPGGGVTTAK